MPNSTSNTNTANANANVPATAPAGITLSSAIVHSPNNNTNNNNNVNLIISPTSANNNNSSSDDGNGNDDYSKPLVNVGSNVNKIAVIGSDRVNSDNNNNYISGERSETLNQTSVTRPSYDVSPCSLRRIRFELVSDGPTLFALQESNGSVDQTAFSCGNTTTASTITSTSDTMTNHTNK